MDFLYQIFRYLALSNFGSDYGKPERIVSAYEIMLEGPIGGAAFNNEFGRQIYVDISSFEMTFDNRRWGYHKPIMLATAMGM